MKKILVATIFTVALIGLAVVPSAKADTVVYNVTSTAGSLNVTFDLASFQNPANDITTFVSGTLFGEPLKGFGISGDSSNCSDGVSFSGPGPCWIATDTQGASVASGGPSFSGLGTFTAGGTTVTITEVVGAPEPSSVALMLLGVGLVFVLQKRNSRGHQPAA